MRLMLLGMVVPLVIGGSVLAWKFWSGTGTTADKIQVAGHAGNSRSTPSDKKAAAAGGDSEPEAGAVTAAPSIAGSGPVPGTVLAGLGRAQQTSVSTGEALRTAARRQADLEDHVLPFLRTHCADCHHQDASEGGITVHDLATVDQLLTNRRKWERVYRMINAGAMPPQDYEPRPSDEARTLVSGILREELFHFDCTNIRHAGRPTLRRLNRAEYNNTIRDLFGLTITPADTFPQDDVGEGFDNIGDVLSLPPLLLEKYLDAAETVASAVIDLRDLSAGQTRRFDGSMFQATGGELSETGFHVLSTNGSVSVTVSDLQAGKYKLRVEAAATQAGGEDARMALQVDGQPVAEFPVTGHRQPHWFEHEVWLTAGSHQLAAEFLNDFYDPEATDGNRRDRNLAVRVLELTGPEGGGEPGWHETHKRFVTARPTESVSVRAAAAAVLRPILYRAFRRPVTDEEVDRFAGLVESAVNDHKDTYDQALAVALQAVLMSTDFLFRVEPDPPDGAADRALNEYEVASRLSYFLWSSMPDEELFQLAGNRRLLDPQILRGQIERMVHDPKADALSTNFAAQWLNLRNLRDVSPNPELFPSFNDELRQAMTRETELLFSTVVRENRSVDDFLTANFTFVNGPLARHYGFEGIQGSNFVRVSLDGRQRSGVLTHASILTLTSNPGRTSPVKRGKWILENILGEAPPPAPPGVPLLEEAGKDIQGLSLRERLEIHRKNPGCASCHKTMDPLGMGLENFDAIGRWRELDPESGKPVDSSGDLPTGETFSGPMELVKVVRARQEQFHRTLIERLMVYALGRGLEYYDKCAVDRTLKLMKERGNRFSAVVEGIVTSDAFLRRSRNREADLVAR